MQARYNAAAAIPIGSLPATMPSFFALFNMLIAFRLVFSPSPAILAILDTPLTGSAAGEHVQEKADHLSRGPRHRPEGSSPADDEGGDATRGVSSRTRTYVFPDRPGDFSIDESSTALVCRDRPRYCTQ